jgi:hypothetical protein
VQQGVKIELLIGLKTAKSLFQPKYDARSRDSFS